MYTSQKTNYEYTNPMILNINNKNVNPYKNENIVSGPSNISRSILPLPIDYQGYGLKNNNTNRFNNQNNFNGSENSKIYVQHSRVGDKFETASLKHSISRYIPENRKEGKQMINLFNKMKHDDINKNTSNYMNANSMVVPTNFSSSISTPLKSYYKNNPKIIYENQNMKFPINRVSSLEKAKSVNSITIGNVKRNNKEISSIKEQQKVVYAPPIKKNINDSAIIMKEGSVLLEYSKIKDDNVKVREQKTLFWGDVKSKDNIMFSRNSHRKNDISEAHDVHINKKAEKVEEKQQQKNNRREGEKKNNRKEGEQKNINRREEEVKKYNRSEEEVKNKEVYLTHKENNFTQNNKKKGGNRKDKQINISLEGSKKRSKEKTKIQSKTLTYKIIKGELPCTTSNNFKEDSLNLNNGLKTFENIIVVDRNHVLKIWNGYEWEEMENYFNFFMKARYDNKGNIWCINNSYEILKLMKNRFKNFGNLANEEIIDIAFDRKNILWCINRKGELLKWNKTKWCKIKYRGFHKLSSLSFDNKGDLWAVNSKRALAIWNKNECNWNEIIIKDNLKISCIDFDAKGKIWVISNSGALLTYSCGNWINFGHVCLDKLISIGFKK
ncbi:thioredoxin-like associated protein 2 [Plasmodium brasilianum]|uniref:Thioredoxin-like associated protein 2, putative n=2 Tax=Plasmodium (Plasmodium) TaxID=418103 RepID=A0A1A8VVQ2_PLAMA|nr:thioredoxin-like associated protein 2, putative [Plasmodium malariae]KAI4837983.1 thioredoxin-like associated protein 2 [Plasmodium brasilianum]SBS83429.1 thioredoxin-like associated protein 2, putative (TLAP2) [Plasmodium malariae]SCN45205.1 thioredoxin-like associated protein 2, putative [Plasmodium malariae]